MKKVVQLLVPTLLLLTLIVFSLPALEAKAAAAKIGVVDASSLNVRSGPGIKYKKVGSLKNKSKVTVYSQTKSGWAQIKYNKKKAYVSNEYLRYYSKMSRANAKKIYDRSMKKLNQLSYDESYTRSQVHSILSPGFTKQYINNFIKWDMMKDENGRYILRATDFPAYNIWGFEWKLGKETISKQLPIITYYKKNGKEYLKIYQEWRNGGMYDDVKQKLSMVKVNGIWKAYNYSW